MRFLRRLTFELSGRQRQDAGARLAKMYRVPPTGPWWPAVGAPLERGVRRRCWHGSEPGADFPARCPNAEYFKEVASDPEVKPVLRLAHEIPTDLEWVACLYPLPESWVMDEDEKDTFDINPHCARGRRPVVRPPCRSTLNFALRASLDDVSKCHG